ncbi:hypothetical protein Glove_303g148 [Diversispora epigaea]|uniref:BTB domain-containing protein n=1 Tax=Diversispora epigaea TaxID=1348612 RepID=A0A397HUZ3_9GLOM|nr:hypothetical protein Glove_303g148 [Diversispora epigaea]
MEFTQENLEKDFEEIILNVGGTRYKTKRSTLTKYPNTLLGQMILNPSNYNEEYFLDRNGRAFHYILEFYRTGKPLWPDESDGVTCEEVEREFEHFQIPSKKDYAGTLAFKAAATTFDQIVSVFEKVIIQEFGNFNDNIKIYFHEDDDLHYKGSHVLFPTLKREEYTLLISMDTQIKRNLENTFRESGLKWEFKKVEGGFIYYGYLEVKISYDIIPELIAQHSKYS